MKNGEGYTDPTMSKAVHNCSKRRKKKVHITANEFQKRSLTTLNREKSMLLWEGTSRISAEAGEVQGVFNKFLFQGHPFDKRHMAMELGDVLCYVAVTAEAIGYTLEQIMEMNIEKREKRYRGEFSTEKSMYRQPGDI